MNLKKRVQALCKEKNVTSQQLEIDLGFGKGYISKLNTSIPNAAKVQKIADYLDIPLDFLLGRAPFEYWERINQDRKNFLRYTNLDPAVLNMLWDIDTEHPEKASAKDFISMLGLCVESAIPNQDDSWAVILRPSSHSPKNAPALTEKDRRDVAKDVYQIMQSLESSGDLMFDGVPMSEESKAAMAAAMRIGLEEARRRNKATYTPKKFRKG